jgi:hypothetical protein
MRNALGLVERKCEEWIQVGLFAPRVLTRFRQWMGGLPADRESLALAIARMAAQTQAGSGAQVNGVALDESAQPSVESLVLFYSALEPHLFPDELVHVAEAKLSVHSGPRYIGPWP